MAPKHGAPSIRELQEILDELDKFLNHPLLCYLLTDDDRKILKYLILFDVNDRKEIKSGYSFTLKFSPNPYFEDACLRKTYTFHDDGIVTITGATIKWKEGMYTGNDDIHKKNDCKKVFSVERLISVPTES